MNPLFPLAVGVGALALLTIPSSAPLSDGRADDPSDDGTPLDYSGGDVSPITNLYPDDTMDAQTQISAFLAVIRQGEASGRYNALVGGGTFSSYATHPALPPTNWPGIVAGGAPTHAAGGYQFQPGTWKECAAALNLTDFSPTSQDAAATFLLKRRGAYQAIVDGQIDTACDLLKNEWQMFTLPRWAPVFVRAMFQNYGGTAA